MSSMKCHKCSERAAIRMRQHRLALCKDHYIEWFVEQTERAIHKYHMFTREERDPGRRFWWERLARPVGCAVAAGLSGRRACTSTWGSTAKRIIRTNPSAMRASLPVSAA